MKSIRTNMLVSFCTVAAFSILILVITIAASIRANLVRLADNLTENLVEQTYDTLKTPHQTFELLLREEIQHSISDTAHTPTLIANLEAGRLKAVTHDLEITAQKHALDFVLVVDFQGQLMASFPAERDDFAIAAYLQSWDFGQAVLLNASQQRLEAESSIWETFAQHDLAALQTLGIDSSEISDEGALSITAASIVRNDFAEPLGIVLTGKLLNRDQRSLQRLHAIAGYASAIYLNSAPIATAGFPGVGEDTGAVLGFQITPAMQAEVYQQGRVTARVQSFANDQYLTACSALATFDQTPIGMLCIGLPAEQINEASQAIVTNGLAARKNVYARILLVSFLVLGFFALVSLAISNRVVTPLKQLSAHARQVALGDFRAEFSHTARNEIGELSDSLRAVVASLREVSATSEAIAVGHLRHQVVLKSEHDTLGQALQYMARYLQDMAVMAEAMARGDLTATMAARSNDDVLGYALQTMTSGLRTLIAQIKDSMQQLTATEAHIASQTASQMRIVTDVHHATQDMVGTMTGMRLSVEEVAQGMDVLSAAVEETSAAVTQLTHSSTQIAANTANLTEQTRLTVAHIDHVVSAVATIADTTDSSQQLAETTMHDALAGQQAVEHVRSSMDTIQHTMTTAVGAMTRFAQRSQEIGKILDVIREITDRTALLALNASIIAAQAGAHGRGFAVVAEEIKSLASGVSGSTKDIAAIVQSLQHETSTVVQTVHEGAQDAQHGMARTQEAQDALTKILSSAQRSSTLVAEIAEALHGLIDISHQVSTAMGHVDDLTDEITLATGGQKSGTNQIHEAIFHINAMASQIRQTTAEQLRGVEHVLEATDTVTGLIELNLQSSEQILSDSQELSSQATLMLHTVDRFKLT